ncbi:MAG: DUF3078 domain-containing protein [Chitinophagia bacterium]|nr:DUF3078 domain-containing protein [Chitinophagia bacterium]
MKRGLVLMCSLLAMAQCLGQIPKSADDLRNQLNTENKDTVALIHSGIFTLGVNEGFLHNWAAGGEVASMTINSIFQGNITYLNHGNIWTNDLNAAYGISYVYSNNFIPRKTDDRIIFTSKYGRRLKKSTDFFYTALFNYQSQFTKGYDYSIPDWQHNPTSNFRSPTYYTVAIGLEYKKGADKSVFLSPVAGRIVTASSKYTSLSSQGAFGIDSGKNARFQFGGYFTARYKVNLSKKAFFSTRLDLYCDYLAKNTNDASGNVIKPDNPGNIKVYWDNLLVIKAYKSLSVNIGLTMAYDNNIPYSKTYLDKNTNTVVEKKQPAESLGWLQLSQVLSLGIAYKFN